MTDPKPPKEAPDEAAKRESYRLITRVKLIVAATAFALGGVAVCGQLCSTKSTARRNAEGEIMQWARFGASQLAGNVDDGLLQPNRFVTPSQDTNSTARLLFKQWSLAVMRETQASATVLADAQGTVVATWPSSVNVGKRLTIPRATWEAQISHSESTGGPPGLLVAIAPLDRGPDLPPRAYACVFSSVEPDLAAHTQSLLVFVAIMTGTTIAAIMLAYAYLRRRVLSPLTTINTRVQRAIKDRKPDSASRGDDLDNLAANIEALCKELDGARQHAKHIEGTIDTVVERRTKHISRLLQRAEAEAEIDPLTKLANRRFIQNKLDGLVEDQIRQKANLVAITFDIDNFKPLNDTEGHAAGDEILGFVGDLLRGSLRENDVGVRMGGDEFAVLMADVTVQEAAAAAERIVQFFAQQMRTSSFKTTVTLSAGVAALDSLPVKTGETLLNAADEALYESKRDGKNLVRQA